MVAWILFQVIGPLRKKVLAVFAVREVLSSFVNVYVMGKCKNNG